MGLMRIALFDYVTTGEKRGIRGMHSSKEPSEPQIVEQFVRSVLDFSSQYGSDISVSYSALNLSGKPSNFPDYGDFPQAFVTRTYGKWWKEAPSAPKDYQPINNGEITSNDFVEIMFQQEVYPTGIRIYETYNPGAIVRIWAMSRKGWVKLWEGEPENVGPTSRLFRPPLRKVDFRTCILKLELSQLHLEEHSQLDAVLLEGTLNYFPDEEVKPEVKNPNDVLFDKLLSEHKLGKTDLTTFIMSIGLHKDLITEWKDDLFLVPTISTPMMGDFHNLPDETIIKIFDYLDLKSLCRCAQVNKRFNRLVLDPLLYKSINLKPYWYCVDEMVLNTIGLRAKLLQKIDLSWCGCDRLPSYECFSQLIQKCGPTLTHLRLDSCRFVDNFILSCITEKCPNLRELSLNSCRNIIPTGFIFLLRLKKLVRLDLYRTKIEAAFLLCVIRQNKELQHLNLGSCMFVSSMDELAIEIGISCKELRSIDLWKNYSLTPVGINGLSNCSKLQEIDLGWCLQICSSTNWIVDLADSCPDLKKVFIGALRSIGDKDLRPLAKCKNLEQLDLFGSAITVDVCELLLKNCEKLKLMDINFCEQVTENQVKMLRETYPSVVIKKCNVS